MDIFYLKWEKEKKSVSREPITVIQTTNVADLHKSNSSEHWEMWYLKSLLMDGYAVKEKDSKDNSKTHAHTLRMSFHLL